MTDRPSNSPRYGEGIAFSLPKYHFPLFFQNIITTSSQSANGR
jgi:hypothetical protein